MTLSNDQFAKAISGTQFEQDLLKPMNIQGAAASLGHYHAIVQASAVKLYAKTAGRMIPTRGWKITDVKKYFGFSGRDNQAFADHVQALKEFVKDKRFVAE